MSLRKMNPMQRMADKVFFNGMINEYIKDFVSGNDIPTEQAVDTELAMKYSAVNACVRVRAETFASVPLVLYRKIKDGREPVDNDNLYDILHYQPNSEMSPYGFKETIMTNFDIAGNAVCKRLVNKAGELVGLYPYHHSIVRIEREDGTGRLVYKMRKKDGTEEILYREDVLHIPNMSFDGVVGLNPITYAAASIRLGLSYERFGVNFYKNSANPGGAFESDTPISDKAFDRLNKELKEKYTGLQNTGRPLLLEEGLKWHQTTVNPIDAQLMESKYFQIEDICRIYRVPQHLVNKLDRSTFSNIEQLSLEFTQFTMLPIFKRFEDCINMQLLGLEKRKKGLYVEANMSGLLRGDAKSRAESYAVGRNAGFLSVNDIRKLENMPPIENGDRYLQPLNMIDVEIANDVQMKNNSNVRAMADEIYEMIARDVKK